MSRARGTRRTRAALSAGVSALLAAMLLAAPALAATEPEAPPAEGTEQAAVGEVTEVAEPITTEIPEAPSEPLPAPKTNEFSLGQSLQIRVNADGTPNSNLANFRWSVNQLTVQGPESGDVEVPVPDRGTNLRSLLDFAKPPQVDGIATLTANVQDGYGLARTVSLFPQDETPPIELTVEFTLNGEPITAPELVGKSGVVTAQYTLTNTSTAPYDVTVTDLAGNPVTKTVEADVPMIAIAGTSLPQSYTGLATGTGQFGADGRGNNQVQWVALPFRPLSEEGTATFGWAANVENAVIPSMLIQVAPVYLPAGEDGQPAAGGGGLALGGLGVTAPNLDPAVAEVQAGVASVLAGLQGFAESDNPDPLTTLEGKLNNFFTTFGTNVQTLATLLDPENPEGLTATVAATQQQIEQLNAVLVQLQGQLTPEVLQQLDFLAQNWPQIATLLQQLNTLLPEAIAILESGRLPIDCRAPDPAQTPAPGTVGVGQLNRAIIGGNYQGHLPRSSNLPTTANDGDSWTFSNNVLAGAAIWRTPEGAAEPQWVSGGLPSQLQACQAALAVAPSLPQYQALLEQLRAIQPVVAQLAAIPALSPDNAATIQSGLLFISQNLSGIVVTLVPITNALSSLLTQLTGTLAEVQAQVQIIATGLTEANVELPTVDEVVSQLTAAVLESPNGQLITSGLGQARTGVGAAKTQLANFAAELLVSVRGVAETAAGVAGDTNAAVVTAKSTVAGLLAAAATSPLPYGGDPANAPQGTVLAGAFEFRVDAADTNQPNTLARIFWGLVALLAGGALTVLAARRLQGASLEDEATGTADSEVASRAEHRVPAGVGVGAAAAGAGVGAGGPTSSGAWETDGHEDDLHESVGDADWGEFDEEPGDAADPLVADEPSPQSFLGPDGALSAETDARPDLPREDPDRP
jgi:hypothetical protein